MNTQRAVARLIENQQTQKEQEILDVASRYFLGHGYKGTSINEMARDSGISKESIYRYFRGKKALFEAVIAKELAAYQGKLKFLDFELESTGLEEALVMTAESILGVVNADRTLALRRLIFHEAGRSPDIGEYYYSIGPREAYEHLERVFVHHVPDARVDPTTLAQYFVAMVLHNRMLQRECGVLKSMTPKQIKKHCETVSRDFIEAFLR
ncbi:MAG: TetR/AcrR family transcriptional regulator [Gammaproteobacteria bacterium]|nr:TetR/AcrR family transcriptional regulator [Gammaproteobacteria bacterium]MDH4253313.1 TetR/AcrR family transcriptional regulator [Gammaproteobacteria bacterium]MDH5309922.1 TetR/AcrR family transcriptional regulator [Gammaproteobacteria bacterium]